MTLTPQQGQIDLNGAGAQPELLSSAFVSLVAWQRGVLDVTNGLLRADNADTDAAINSALAKTGALAGSDRTYVFRVRDRNRLDNTHEWVEQGIAPAIDQLQDLPDDLLADWRDDLGRGQHIYIANIAALPVTSVVRDILLDQQIKSLLVVPMLQEGRLTGFVGYDSVREHRQFLEPEIELIKLVANTISAVTQRAEALAAAQAANAGLVAQSERLNATLSAIPDLLVEFNCDGRFVGVYSGGSVRSTLPQDGFIGRLVEEVVEAPRAAFVRKIMAEVDRVGPTTGHEYQLAGDDGDVGFYQVSATEIWKGPSKGYVMLVRDVTELHRQEAQILRLNTIAKLTSNLVVMTDAQDRIEWVNPAFEQRSGWKLAELKGSRPKSLLQAGTLDIAARRKIGAAIRNGMAFTGELLNKSRSGEEYWTKIDISPIRDSTGTLTGFVAIQADITDIKQTHERAIKDLDIAIQATEDSIFLSSPEGAINYANPAFRRLFGLAPDEDANTMTLRDILRDSPFTANEETNSSSSTGAWRGEVVGHRRDGSTFNLEISLTRREGGGSVVIARDISERLRMEEERAGLRDELQIVQRNEMIAHLATGVAHDLNNLIAVVDGSADIIETRASDEAEVLAGASRIRRAIKSARELVTTLGRLDRPAARLRSLDLRDLAKECAYLLGNQRLAQNNVIVTLPDEPSLVWGDATDLQQVIANLAINACDAKSDHPNRVELSVLAQSSAVPARAPDVGYHCADGDYSVIVISDTGTGVEPVNRAKLFERYFTTKGKLGTGLGMTVVASIIRDNEAALWFDTTPGQGSTVTVAWPSARHEDVDDHDASVAHAAMPLPLKGKRILIVDDMADVGDVLAAKVRMAGASVIVETNSARALELIADTTQSFSVILTDLDMPGHNGIDLARAASLRDPALPVILVTALTVRAARHRELFAAILAKPVDGSQLIMIIKAAATG